MQKTGLPPSGSRPVCVREPEKIPDLVHNGFSKNNLFYVEICTRLETDRDGAIDQVEPATAFVLTFIGPQLDAFS